MTVPGLWRSVRIHWVIFVVATILGVLAGLGMTALSTPSYTAQADVLVAVSTPEDASQDAPGVAYAQDQAQNFAAVATRGLVLRSVIGELGLDTSMASLRDHIRTSVRLNTSIISISVTDDEPERAAAIANAVASNLSSVVPVLVPGPAQLQPWLVAPTGQEETVRIQSVEQAVAPVRQSSPNATFNLMLGLLAGLAAGAVLAAMRQSFIDARLSPPRG